MTPAYAAACRTAARVYDRRELARRNEAEGFATRRLADEYADDFMALFCERPWFTSPHVEVHRAALTDLLERLGEREFDRVAAAWRDAHLIPGVDR